MFYKILRFLFRIAVRIFFRRIEVEGLENVPDTGPTLLLPNHPNALVDALVILMHLNRPVTLTAKSTLADYPLLGFVFRTARVILLYRKQDEKQGVDRSRNIQALAECRGRLKKGEAICLFPEGQSHSDPSLRPFRWGAARVALDFGLSQTVPPPLKIIPVGLNFLHKEQFRSDVWIRFGEPIDLGLWMKSNPEGGPAELTAEIEERVRDLTLNFERRRDSILMDWAADILGAGGMPPAPLGQESWRVAAHLSLVGLLRDGYEALRDTRARELDDLRNRVRKYRSELRRLGITPREVYILITTKRVALFVLREGAVLMIGLPVALWGAVNHLFPALIVRAIVKRISVKRDQWASNTVVPAVVIFPVFYVIQITLAWLLLTPLWAAAYTILLPFSGYGAVRYRDRAGGTLQRVHTFFHFLKQSDLQPRLAEEGLEIINRIQMLGEELERLHSLSEQANSPSS